MNVAALRRERVSQVIDRVLAEYHDDRDGEHSVEAHDIAECLWSEGLLSIPRPDIVGAKYTMADVIADLSTVAAMLTFADLPRWCAEIECLTGWADWFEEEQRRVDVAGQDL